MRISKPKISKLSFGKQLSKFTNETTSDDIDLDIFKGLSSREEIDAKFNNFTHRKRHSSHQRSGRVYDQSHRIYKLINKSFGTEPLKSKYSRLCQEFGINYKYMQQLKTSENREDYVLQCMNRAIEDALRSFDKNQIEQSFVRQAEDEKLYRQKPDFLDLFDWLKVKSQYEQISKLLKYVLIDAASDPKNQQKALEYFNIDKSQLNLSRSTNGIKIPQSSSINRSNLPSETRIKSQEKSTKDSVNPFGSPLQTPRANFNQTIPEIQTERTFESRVASPYLNLDISTVIQKLIDPTVNQQTLNFREWNMAIEQGFIRSRLKAEKRFTKDISSTSWNQSGFYPIIHEEIKLQGGSGINNKKRDDLAEKYTDGNYLTAQELKFLTNTSYLITKGMDRNFIQKAINFLDGEVLQDIEHNIAEQVLKRYYDSLDALKSERNKWLETNNIKKRNKIREREQKNLERLSKQRSDDNISRINKKLFKLLKNYTRKQIEKDIKEEQKYQQLKKDRLKGNNMANKFVLKFKDKMMAIVQRFRKKKQKTPSKNLQFMDEFLERNYPHNSKPFIKINKNTLDVNQFKRFFHPPSKIILKSTSSENLKLSTSQRQARNKQEQKKYHLNVRGNSQSQACFQLFYTGGPMQTRQYKNPQLSKLNQVDEDLENQPQSSPWITKEIEIQAINRIKRAIKNYIDKKNYKKIKEEGVHQKNLEIEKQIQRYLKARDVRQAFVSVVEKAKSPYRLTISENRGRANTKGSKKTPLNPDKKEGSLSKSPGLATQIKFQFEQEFDSSEVLLKHRKLLTASKMGILAMAQSAGFVFNEQDVCCVDSLKNCPLYYAAQNKDEEFCRFLLKYKADINQKCQGGNTPLHMAFKSGDVNVLILLIQCGGDLNVLNDEGQTPIAFGSDQILTYLNLKDRVATVKNLDERYSFNNNMKLTQRLKPYIHVPDDRLEFKQPKIGEKQERLKLIKKAASSVVEEL